jgi:phosphoglycolate phosphatase-like HAD superfamily hydrolase
MDGTLIILEHKPKYHGPVTQHTPYLSIKAQMKRIAIENGVPEELVMNKTRMAHIWNTVRRFSEETKSPNEVEELMRKINEPFMVEERSEHDISKLLPDTIHGLQALKDEGYEMGLVTTASRESYDRLSQSDEFKRFGRFFSNSLTRDDVSYIKPEPEPIKRMMELMGRTDVIYIGDSDHDGLAASAAGCRFILINTREYDEHTINSFTPDGVIEKLTELPIILKELTQNS